MEKIKIDGQIQVIGRRWFQKSYGNTYHSVTINVNGEEIYNPFTYGYESHYRQTAHKMLLENGYDVPEEYTDFIHMDNITFDVYDVDRKKDL